MNNLAGYSIWFGFDIETQRTLSSLINTFANRVQAPRFTPHLTLLGQVQLDSRFIEQSLYAMLDDLNPIPLTLERAEISENYYRALVLRAGQESPLHELRGQIAEHLGLAPKSVYLPHVSLLYGQCSAAQKEGLVVLAEEHLPIHSTLIELMLVKTEGTVQEWELIKKMALPESS